MKKDHVRLRLYFTFDGTGYHGWQFQNNRDRTFQQVLEEAMKKIAKQKINVVASGRTDAGVHARIQVAHADFPAVLAKKMLVNPKTKKGIPFKQNKLTLALNSLLPKGLRIYNVEIAPNGFRAINDVDRKTYVYFIDINPIQMPILSRYSWHLKIPLNWKAIEVAAKKLEGTHDFKAFCASDSQVKSSIRTIYEINIEKFNGFNWLAPIELYAISITGNGFLKQMVRSIIGTLVKVGNERVKPELIDELLRNKNRSKIGATAPAHGLWLWDVKYKKSVFTKTSKT